MVRRSPITLTLYLIIAALAGAGSAEAQCVRVGGGVSPPVRTVYVEPIYPPSAMSAGVQGVVILEIQIATTGAVSDVRVLRSIPLLDQAAIDAVYRWQYQPTVVGGVPVCVIMTVTVQFTLQANPAPTDLSASVSGPVVSLSWTPATGGTPIDFLVEAGSAPGLANLAAVRTGTPTPSFSAAAPDGTYFVRVKAVYATGPSAPSNEVMVNVGCSAPPPAPPTLTYTQDAGGSPVHFSWSPPSANVESYRLEAGTASGASNLAVLPLPASATSYSTPAPPGQYFVRVRAVNRCGVSAPSPEIRVSVGQTCVTPSAPQALVSSVSGHVVTLGWQPPLTGSAPLSYTVVAGTLPGGNNVGTFPVGPVTGLQATAPPNQYFVRVHAANVCGTSGPSNEVLAVVPGG